MENKERDIAVARLEELLQKFREAKARGKETNDNAERVQSISEIEEVTEALETYVRNNPELLEQITGTKIEVAREIKWDDIVRPAHFEEDLQGEIDKLKKQAS